IREQHERNMAASQFAFKVDPPAADKRAQIGSGAGFVRFGQGNETDISSCLQPSEPYKILSDRPEELTCPCKEQCEAEPGHFAQACQSACSSEEEANEQAAQPAFAPGEAR